jgi:hypothetical protein
VEYFEVAIGGVFWVAIRAEPVLTMQDTHYAVARYIENVFKILSQSERIQIENAIVNLPMKSDGEQRRRMVLIGYLPEESIVTDAAKELRRNAEVANSVKPSRPLFEIGTGWVERPSIGEELAEEGVNVQEGANRRLLDLIEPVREAIFEKDRPKQPYKHFRMAYPTQEATLPLRYLRKP